jgi:hypothetical protein
MDSPAICGSARARRKTVSESVIHWRRCSSFILLPDEGPIMVLELMLSFVVSLLLGGVAIYVGASVVTDVQDYGTALSTALIATLAVFVTHLLTTPLGWIPGLGWLPLLVGLVVYLAVINSAYPGGWGNAAAITVVAWVAGVVGQLVLGVVGLGVNVVGVPGI